MYIDEALHVHVVILLPTILWYLHIVWSLCLDSVKIYVMYMCAYFFIVNHILTLVWFTYICSGPQIPCIFYVECLKGDLFR